MNKLTASFYAYLARWRNLPVPARLYLWHIAMLTWSLASVGLLFNVAVLAMGYSVAELGRVNLAAVWASLAASLPLWWLVTRIGLRAGLICHAALQSAAIAAYALAPSLPLLLAAAALAGAAAVLFQVSAPPLMMQHSDAATRDHLFSASEALTIGVFGLGSLVAGLLPALFGLLLGVTPESALAYRATFALAAGGVALSIIPLLLGAGWSAPVAARRGGTPPEQAAMPNTSTIAGIRAFLRQPGPLLALLVAPALISLGAALLLPYLNLFFKQRFELPDALLGLIFALLNVSTGLAVLAGPALSLRLGKRRAMALAQALSIPFLLLQGFVPLIGVAVAAAALRGALFNMARPLYDAFAMERTPPPHRPLVIGLIGGASTSGYLVAPVISTWVQARYGFAPLFVATALCYGLATLAILVLFNETPPQVSDDAPPRRPPDESGV